MSLPLEPAALLIRLETASQRACDLLVQSHTTGQRAEAQRVIDDLAEVRLILNDNDASRGMCASADRLLTLAERMLKILTLPPLDGSDGGASSR